MGIIKLSTSRYISPLFMVPKKDGSLRIVQVFLSVDCKKPRWQIFYEGHQWVYWIHWMCMVHHFHNFGSDFRILADALGGAIKTLNSINSAQNGAVQVDHESNGTTGMSSFNSNGNELHNQCDCLHWCYPLAFKKPFWAQRTTGKTFWQTQKCKSQGQVGQIMFGANNVSYLGYTLTAEGIWLGWDKLKAVREIKPQSTVQKIGQFMGLYNFLFSCQELFLMLALLRRASFLITFYGLYFSHHYTYIFTNYISFMI